VSGQVLWQVFTHVMLRCDGTRRTYCGTDSSPPFCYHLRIASSYFTGLGARGTLFERQVLFVASFVGSGSVRLSYSSIRKVIAVGRMVVVVFIKEIERKASKPGFFEKEKLTSYHPHNLPTIVFPPFGSILLQYQTSFTELSLDNKKWNLVL